MHLLAELMDNAANFSPPIDEVHVYVEERSAGLVITIEDSGLKMSDASMRRAAESVSGQVTDLASLQGTRLGLSVVGRLAAKHGISVNYRPSSRGGTGVVVLLPPQLVAQQREPVAPEPPRRGAEVPTAASAPAVEETLPLRPQAVALAGEAPRADVPGRPTAATANGLPVRAPAAPWPRQNEDGRRRRPSRPGRSPAEPVRRATPEASSVPSTAADRPEGPPPVPSPVRAMTPGPRPGPRRTTRSGPFAHLRGTASPLRIDSPHPVGLEERAG